MYVIKLSPLCIFRMMNLPLVLVSTPNNYRRHTSSAVSRPTLPLLHHPQTSLGHQLTLTGIFQISDGFGVGFAFGQPSYVVQTVLSPSDVPIGVTLITLMQNLSASVFVAVAQSIFQGQLLSDLQAMDLPVKVDVSTTGAAQIVDAVPIAFQEEVRKALSRSLVNTFYISLALSCASVIGALSIRWGSMKGSNAAKGEKSSSNVEAAKVETPRT